MPWYDVVWNCEASRPSLSLLPCWWPPGGRLFRLQKKLLVALGHVLDGGGSADGPLELPPLLIIDKGNAVEHGGDSADQAHIDTALRLGKFQGHASYLLMAVTPKRVYAAIKTGCSSAFDPGQLLQRQH